MDSDNPPRGNLKTTGLYNDSDNDDDLGANANYHIEHIDNDVDDDDEQEAFKPIAVPIKEETKTVTKKKRKRRDTSVAVDTRNKPFKPIRDYYHSISFIKIKDNEWETNIDSDDEADNAWRKRLEKSELYEFTDVPKPEKDIMHLWNAYVRSDTVIRNKSIPQLCLRFVETHAKDIQQAGLAEQLPSHLFCLWEEGLINRDHLAVCMDQFHKLANGTHVLLPVIDEKSNDVQTAAAVAAPASGGGTANAVTADAAGGDDGNDYTHPSFKHENYETANGAQNIVIL